MAYLIPPDYPNGTSPGEALVFDLLRDGDAGRGWTVLHSLHLPQHVRQIEGEADFVILMPGLGVLCVEVKSHLIADYVDGAWYLGSGASPDYRGPFRQAEMEARSVKKKVVSVLPAASSILFWSAVVFTHCVPAVRGSAGDWHRWELLTATEIDRDPLDLLLEGIMRRARDHVSHAEKATWFDPASRRPTVLDCEHIRAILRPDVHFLPATTALRHRRRAEIRRFTEEQLVVIEGLDGLNDRALVEGPAGTGKTVLAFEEARRAASLGKGAALICFNQQLALHLRRDAADFGLLGVDIVTFHSLMQQVADVETPNGTTRDYWEQELPDLALSALMDTGPRYETLIVDEAQDLARAPYLDVMDALLDGALSEGCWRMFADFERQAIFGDDTEGAKARIMGRAAFIARFALRRNCRNIPRVAEYVVRLGGLSPGYSRVLRPDCGPEGTPHTSFYRSDEHQQELLREELEDIESTGEFEAEDIVILSPLVDSCAAKLARRRSIPPLERLPSVRSGASSYGTVASFKGLEAPAIVLTDIEEVTSQRAQRLFYIGVSRATDRLRVLARDGLQAAFARLVTGGNE